MIFRSIQRSACYERKDTLVTYVQQVELETPSRSSILDFVGSERRGGHAAPAPHSEANDCPSENQAMELLLTAPESQPTEEAGITSFLGPLSVGLRGRY